MVTLISKIIELSRSNKLIEIEKLLEEQLRHEPNNVELWLRLAVLELASPLNDCYKGIACLEKILALEENNPVALLLLAYINHYELGGINKTLMEKLNSIHTNSAELNSMLKYAISWFYFEKDAKLEEQFLKASISIYKNHVWNYVRLAKLCFKQSRKVEAKDFIQTALKNVKKVYSPGEYIGFDITDINKFLNENIKGIYLSKENIKEFKKLK